ncbi:MAG: chemotaxis protein CheA [Syntrophaceae bacterium]
MDAQKQLFREEAYELLTVLEGALLDLEQNPGDGENIGKVFRAMHTLKGSGAMFGFDDIAAFTHTIETVYNMVRDGELAVTQELVSLTLKACDQIRAMLDASLTDSTADTSRTAVLAKEFQKYIPAGDNDDTQENGNGHRESSSAPQARLMTYRIRFSPHRDLFANGTNPIPLLNELKGMGECTMSCSVQDLPELQEMDPEACYASWDIILTTSAGEDVIRGIFIFVEDISDLSLEVIQNGTAFDSDIEYKKVGEILLDRGVISQDDLDKALGSQKRIGEVLLDEGMVDRAQIGSALAEQEQIRAIRKKRAAVEESSSIRVPAPKLDDLVNLVGELVTIQARLTQHAAQRDDPDLVGIAEEVERLSSALRDIAMGIRMLPIGTLFSKYKRLVRDLSHELNKDIGLVMEGEETELDKAMIDKLSDPLVHLIRNCIDHGIESTSERVASGKLSQGTITVSARHSGAYVLISITDDGKGLDTEAIRAKAVEKGLIPPDATLDEHEIQGLIFVPGFSTSSAVTSVSGRGVGMDVVKTGIEGLGGRVEISSAKGHGTTITLKLPLTLAIIDGLLVAIGNEFFIIPLGVVVECVDLTADDIKHAHGRQLIKVREEIIPYINLRRHFGLTSERPPIEQVVITELGGFRIGFVVDKVVGQHQTVIKNLGRMLKEIDGVSGATIMGDGTVALILDVNKLVGQAEVGEATASNGAGAQAGLKMTSSINKSAA